MIDGETRIGGIIGAHTGFSLSPFIHNASGQILGLNIAYLPFSFPDERAIPEFLASSFHGNTYGFNITVPFKESVARLYPTESLNSCNVLTRGQETWQAFSSDGPGFVRGLAELEKTPRDFAHLLVLGNGGSAKALVRTLLAEHPKLDVRVLRRNPAGDKLWEQDERVRFVPFSVADWEAQLRECPGALIIQCTSAPLHGDDLMGFAAGLKDPQAVFCDLLYRQPTALLKAARARGIKCQDGLPMLLHQALLSQEYWWGMSAPAEQIYPGLKAKAYCA